MRRVLCVGKSFLIAVLFDVMPLLSIDLSYMENLKVIGACILVKLSDTNVHQVSLNKDELIEVLKYIQLMKNKVPINPHVYENVDLLLFNELKN